MRVRYIDDPQVTVMQRNPIRESLGLGDGSQGVHQHRVVLAEDQRRRHGVEAQWLAERPWPLAHHCLSRRGKDVDTERVRRDGYHVHSPLNSMMMLLSMPDT